jgi:uncharacterized protein (TIGR03067 family)
MRLFALGVLATVLAVGCGKKPEPTRAPSDAPGKAPALVPSAASDRDRVQGTWKVTKVEWPEADKGHAPTRQEIDGVVLTIKGDRITATFDGKIEELSHIVFAEDTSKTPRRVNLIATDGPNSREPIKHQAFGVGKDGKPTVVSTFTHPPLQAIYKFEGDALILAFPIDPDADRPTEFKPGMVNLPERRGGLETAVVVVHLKKK